MFWSQPMSIASAATASMHSLPTQAAEAGARAFFGFSYWYWFSPGVSGVRVT